jgi:hypothetical protein
LLASPAAVVKPKRVPTMKGALRPRSVDETVMEILLNLFSYLLKVLVRIDVDSIWLVEELPAH